MTKITASDIRHLAKLSRLHITDDEVETYLKDISSIFGFIDQLQSVDVSDYPPTDQVSGRKNVTRLDELADYGVKAQDLLPDTDKQDSQFIVKRVIK